MKSLPSLGEHFIEDVGDCGAVTWRYERLAAEIGHADVRCDRGTVGCEGGHRLLLAQVLHGELIGDLAGQKTESGVEFVCRKSAEHVGGDALGQTDVDTRMSAAEPCQQPRHVDVTGGEQCATQMCPRKTPRSSSTSWRAPSSSARMRRARPAMTCPASVGRTRRLVRSNSGVQLVFQPLDLVGEGRLGEVQFLSSPRKVAAASDGLDADQLPQFHMNDRKTRLVAS